MKYIPRTLHIIRSCVVHFILGGACCFTAFPFLWMAVSSLKTKEEVMAVDIFFPSDPQYQNYSEILFHSPIPRYLANSLLVAVSVCDNPGHMSRFFYICRDFYEGERKEYSISAGSVHLLYGAYRSNLHSMLYDIVQVRTF